LKGIIAMSNNVSAIQEATVTLSIQQLEGIIRKVVREELMDFATQERGLFNLDKESPLYEDMEDILERKKSGRLKFYTHKEIWGGGHDSDIRSNRAGEARYFRTHQSSRIWR